MSRLAQALQALRDERAALREDLDWLDEQIAAFEARVAGAGAAAGRATPPAGRPASRSSAGSRRRTRAASAAAPTHGDLRQRIIAFLAEHPQSTAGDVAKGIGEDRSAVATRLVELARTGEIAKAPRGYSAGEVRR